MNRIVNEDYYFEKGLMVMTAKHHMKRGYCCGSGCRHCPFTPRHVAGSTIVITRLQSLKAGYARAPRRLKPLKP